jgi:hypothetical protein
MIISIDRDKVKAYIMAPIRVLLEIVCQNLIVISLTNDNETNNDSSGTTSLKSTTR